MVALCFSSESSPVKVPLIYGVGATYVYIQIYTHLAVKMDK